MTDKQWELIWSVLKHAGIVGLVAFFVALGQGVTGADWSSFGPIAGPIAVPMLLLFISTIVKALQKSIEITVRDTPPNEDEDDGNDVLPYSG